MLFGGRKESFPQLRLVSAGLDQPAQPTPFLVFKIAFVVSLPLRIFALQDNGGAHPLVMDALAEMSEAQMQMCLTVSSSLDRDSIKTETILLDLALSYRRGISLRFYSIRL